MEGKKITIIGENGYVSSDRIREVRYHIDKSVPNVICWQNLDEETTVVTPYIISASGTLQDLYLNGHIEEIKDLLNGKQNSIDNIKTMELIDKILADTN